MWYSTGHVNAIEVGRLAILRFAVMLLPSIQMLGIINIKVCWGSERRLAV